MFATSTKIWCLDVWWHLKTGEYIVKNKMVIDGELIISDSHRYKTKNCEISMLTPCKATFSTFEIYELSGSIDVERYKTKKEAEKRIYQILGGN